jgi:hypothetical protein
MNRFFIDKTFEGSLQDGLNYHAAGIIDCDYTVDGKGNESGKDYSVTYIDPLGVRFKQSGEVLLI